MSAPEPYAWTPHAKVEDLRLPPATALIGVAAEALPEPARHAIAYAVDIGPIAAERLVRFLARRLDEASFPAPAIDGLATRLDSGRLGNRTAAAAACAYLRDRATYEGDAFSPSDAMLDEAIEFARKGSTGGDRGGALRAA